MIRDFEMWTETVGDLSRLEEMRGTRIGVEAAHYIQTRILNNPRAKEPLVPALGGLPLGLNDYIVDDLKKFEEFQIELFFIFSGLELSRSDDPFRQRQEGAAVNAAAWQLYDQHEAQQSVQKFGESPYITPDDLFRALQSILTNRKVPFLVAPYSAWPQLAYLEKTGKVNAISGASEILLFDCDKVITSWDLENAQFAWVKRGKCVAELKKYAPGGDVTDDMFVDACMLAGTHFLPTLPSLETRSKLWKPQGAMEMMVNNGRTGISVVLHYQDDPRSQRVQYVDKYKRARLTVKHHPLLTSEGKIEPLLEGQLPNDAHEIIGHRLPDEILYYLSRGLINARVLGWRAASEIIEAPPMDGGDSPEYQNLVSRKLTPLRTTAINILSSSLHNWYQHKDITLKCWFPDQSTGKPYTSTISLRNLPEWKDIVKTWNVKEKFFKDVTSQYKPYSPIGAAILSLQNLDFLPQSVVKKDDQTLLSTTTEVLFNSLWRFLALREYVDANHNLTSWGRVLVTVITALNGKTELEESAILAVELLRLGMLNADDMFPYNGAPMRGDARDRKFNLLISRVAGVGSLHHKPIGFTGPLSQHLLGFNSVVTAVRTALRDLVEVSSTQMFMSGCVNREVAEIPELSMNLPFLLPNNCALSIAVKSYLDELHSQNGGDATSISAETKAAVKDTATNRYFPQSENFVGDLDKAFELWDAVLEGVKVAPKEAVSEREKRFWGEADGWLAARR